MGKDSFDEIDYTTLDGARDANFGWDAFEGTLADPCPGRTIGKKSIIGAITGGAMIVLGFIWWAVGRRSKRQAGSVARRLAPIGVVRIGALIATLVLLADPLGLGATEGSAAAPADHTPLVFEYSHAEGCSITGGLVVNDPELPALFGRYPYADFCQGQLQSLIASPDGAADNRALGVELSTPTSFNDGHENGVYATSLTEGVFQLVDDGGD